MVATMLFFITTVTCLIVPVMSKYHGDSCGDRINPGICTPLSQCQPLMEEIRAAGSPMPMDLSKRLNESDCGYIQEEPSVCCSSQSSETSKPNTVKLTIEGNSIEAETDSRPNEPDFGDEPEDVSDHPNLKLLPTNCGYIESDRIIGGHRTHLYEMPWMVLISYANDNYTLCGGTLINEWYVLTAAHCVKTDNDTTIDGVILGEYDVRTDPDCEVLAGKRSCAPKVVNAKVAEVIAHPGYRRETLFDDIALIRLAEPANFDSDSIGPICLPYTRDRQLDIFDGLFGVVAGWGATDQRIRADVLLSVKMEVIPNDLCKDLYKDQFRIYKGQLCAGVQKKKKSCGGDSGGPFMHPGLLNTGSARYIQQGIVSFGLRICGGGYKPDIFTRVAYYMKWILDNMRS